MNSTSHTVPTRAFSQCTICQILQSIDKETEYFSAATILKTNLQTYSSCNGMVTSAKIFKQQTKSENQDLEKTQIIRILIM